MPVASRRKTDLTRTRVAVATLLECAPAVMQQTVYARGNGLAWSRCILASAVGVDTLARFGVHAEPMSVRITVANPAYEDYCHQVAIADAMQQPRPDVEEAYRRGAWCLDSRDHPDSGRVQGNEWFGHLMIHVPSLYALIDLDFRQFDRPAKNIAVPPTLYVPWRYGERVGTRLDNDITITVSGCPTDATWQMAANWVSRDRNLAIVDALAARVSANLAVLDGDH